MKRNNRTYHLKLKNLNPTREQVKDHNFAMMRRVQNEINEERAASGYAEQELDFGSDE